MTETVVALSIAALAGMTMALQGSLNSALGKVAGLWEATFLVHVVGLVFVTLLLPIVGAGSFRKLVEAPWYTWLGGTLGVLIVFGVAASIPRIGVAPATTAIIIAQVLTACTIDHFGLFGLQRLPFGWSKLLGSVLLAMGGWFLLRR